MGQSQPMPADRLRASKGSVSSWKEQGVIGVLSLGQSSRGRTSWPQAQPETHKTWVSPNFSSLDTSPIRNSLTPYLTYSVNACPEPLLTALKGFWVKGASAGKATSKGEAMKRPQRD